MPTTVVNKRTSPYDVYIGRGSIWGNPFVIGRDGDRAEVIRKHAAHLKNNPDLMSRISELSGKRLGCFCAPLACHGDTLAELADKN